MLSASSRSRWVSDSARLIWVRSSGPTHSSPYAGGPGGHCKVSARGADPRYSRGVISQPSRGHRPDARRSARLLGCLRALLLAAPLAAVPPQTPPSPAPEIAAAAAMPPPPAPASSTPAPAAELA